MPLWSTPEAIATALSTDLNSLANITASTASAAIGNATGKYTHMIVEVFLSTLSPASASFCSLFLIPSADGTNYPEGGGGVLPSDVYRVASWDIATGVSVTRRFAAVIEIPPFDFKLVFYQKTGSALAASGNTVKYRRFALA